MSKVQELKELLSLLGSDSQTTESNTLDQNFIGKKVIIRTYSAGVWFGVLGQKSGNEVIIKNARRMWYWKAKESISLSAVAIYGIDPSESRIAPPVECVWLEAIEIIPTTQDATKSIEDAKNAETK